MKITIVIIGALFIAGPRFMSSVDARSGYFRPAHTFSNWGAQP